MRNLIVALGVVGLLAGPALASQCPLLIKQVMDATAGKTDDASKKAQTLASLAKVWAYEAKALHDAGKHAESVAKADEAAKAINLTLKKK